MLVQSFIEGESITLCAVGSGRYFRFGLYQVSDTGLCLSFNSSVFSSASSNSSITAAAPSGLTSVAVHRATAIADVDLITKQITQGSTVGVDSTFGVKIAAASVGGLNISYPQLDLVACAELPTSTGCLGTVIRVALEPQPNRC